MIIKMTRDGARCHWP